MGMAMVYQRLVFATLVRNEFVGVGRRIPNLFVAFQDTMKRTVDLGVSPTPEKNN